MNNTIEIDDFLKVSIHTGTILSAELNKKARKPAFVMDVDFGEELGVKKTSAQITEFYDAEKLIGRQIVAITNFAPLRVAGVKSEVLVLGVVTAEGVVLLGPDQPVINGLKIA
jgi:tRNA-binding protein